MSEVRTPGGITSYAYDLAGRLKKASGEDGLRASYRYTKHGRESEILYGSGLLTSKGYDERKRLVSLKTSFEGKEPLFTARYRYDRNGNRIRKEECISGRNETTDYGYDCLGQLTAEERSGRSVRYGYDPAGNRVRKETADGTERYRYNERNQLLERSDGKKTIQYQYDPAGNLTGEWQVKNTEGNIEPLELDICYQYDVFRRNTEVKGTGYLQKNRYDAEGYRYETEENGQVSRYVYHNGMLLAELNEVNEKPAGQYLGNAYIGGKLALKAGRNQTAEAKQTSENAQDKHAGVLPEQKMCYYVSDEQGSIRYVVDETGAVLNRYQYDAFGMSEAGEETCQNRLRYNGQIYDALTGQYYLRARYYQPDVGRFMQEDALYADGLNLYAYCKSNPVMYCDPSGLKKKKCEVNEAENTSVTSPGGDKSDISRKEALQDIKQDLGIPKTQQPDSQRMVMLHDEYGNPIVENGKIVYSRELTYSVSGKTDAQGLPVKQVIIQDHSDGHTYSSGIGNQPSHFNVRPDTNIDTGSVSGMKDHSYFTYKNKK